MVPVKTFEKGKSGLAKVRVVKDKVKVTFSGETRIYEMFTVDCPEGIQTGEYLVTLDKEGSRVMYVSPPDGDEYVVKFIGFSRDKDGNIQPPILIKGGDKKTNKQGNQYVTRDQIVSWAIYEITSGTFEGWQLRMRVPYAWEPWTDGEEAAISGSGSKRLLEWLGTMKFDIAGTHVPFSDNVLPVLEKLILGGKPMVFTASIRNGYINSLSKIPDALLGVKPDPDGVEDEEEIEETEEEEE